MPQDAIRGVRPKGIRCSMVLEGSSSFHPFASNDPYAISSNL